MQKTMEIVKNGEAFGIRRTGDSLAVAYFIPLL